jgi:PAS domain S-box-containing protein
VRERTADLQKLNEDLKNEVIERKLKEEGMKKASNEWRITFDSTRDMILMLDRDFRIVRLNRAAAEFMNLPFEKLIGQYFFRVFSPSDINRNDHPLSRTFGSGRHEMAEIHLKSRDIWVQALVDPVKDEKGNVTGAVHIIRDITEQKNLHSQLLHAQKMESIGRLAGGIAHDFNNLLSAIMGYTELSLLKLPENSPVKNYLTLVREGSEKAAALTQRLLAFSRKQLLQIRPVDLNAVIEGMMKMVSRILREDIILELNLSPASDLVMADPVQIEQIIMNLVVNARDAMPDGGRLTISTSGMQIDNSFIIRHEHAIPGPYVLLAVSDTGIGMSRQIQERIFEPFFTTKGMGEGTGLGLATVYGIVKQHNGYIYVYSEEGKGTTFKIYLPVSEKGAEETLEQEQPQMTGGTETILVVDDDNFIRSLIKDIFSTLGYNLLFACDGEDALRVAEKTEGTIDLLLTDIIMPNMNGRLLAEHFRREYPGTKIIFMSGYTEETLSRQADLELGDLLIQKPISPSLLASSIREVLDRK